MRFVSLLLGLAVIGVLAASPSSVEAAIEKNKRPRITFVKAKLNPGGPLPDFVDIPTLDVTFRYCDDSRGYIDYANGPGRLWIKLTRRQRGVARVIWRLRREPIAFNRTCLRSTIGTITKQKIYGPGRVVMLLRVRDPEGKWSRTVRKELPPVFRR